MTMITRRQQRQGQSIWIEKHRTDSVTLEENIFLDALLRWVDIANTNTTTEIGDPFFLSNLTGATHWLYKNAPGADFEDKWYSDRRQFNSLLNTIAYQDRFISNIFLEFEKRGLTNSTLFVLTGDHGSNFANRNG